MMTQQSKKSQQVCLCKKTQGTRKQISQSLRNLALAIAITLMVPLAASPWGLHSALADRKPRLGLTISGTSSISAGKPVDNIIVRLKNPDHIASLDSRLRLFVQDEEDREVRRADIKIEVLEGSAWKEVETEAIDGGVMGAIGLEGQRHNDRHQHGGFAIGKRANKNWRFRMTFRLAGRYSLLFAVSPDNGETHVAKPASFNMVVL